MNFELAPRQSARLYGNVQESEDILQTVYVHPLMPSGNHMSQLP
jgi:hypothetical protein